MKNIIKTDNSLIKVLLIGANSFLGTIIIQLLDLNDNLKQKFSLIAADIRNTNNLKNKPI